MVPDHDAPVSDLGDMHEQIQTSEKKIRQSQL